MHMPNEFFTESNGEEERAVLSDAAVRLPFELEAVNAAAAA